MTDRLRCDLTALIIGLAATGTWHGELLRHGDLWRAELHVDEAAGEGRVSFPDFGMFQLEMRALARDGERLGFETTWIDSRFEGTVQGEYLTGAWSFEGRGDAEARFHRASEHPGILRTEPVTITADDGAVLAGRLVLPDGDPPYAGMVLTHGSGPDTRTTGPYIGKANLAASKGLAVLVWDKRGAGESTGEGAYRIERLAGDAKHMVEHLRADPRVDAARVGIGGISQGGWVAPMLAAGDPELTFVFGTAMPGVSPAEQNVFSLRTRLEARDPAAVRPALATLRAVYEYYRTGSDGARTEAERRLAAADPSWAATDLFRRFLFWPDGELPVPVDTAAYATMFVDPLMWWRQITVPVFAVWGGDDGNVPPTYSRAVIEASLDVAGNADRRLIVFPNAGHGLSRTDRPESEWPKAAPGYVEAMGAWFERRTR